MDLEFYKEMLNRETLERQAKAVRYACERTGVSNVQYYSALKKNRFDELTPSERKILFAVAESIKEVRQELVENYESLKDLCAQNI